MSIIYNQVLLHWLDVNGKTATQFITTLDQTAGGSGAYSSLAAAFAACSYAGLAAIQFQTTLVVGGAASSGAYQSVTDRAAMLSRIQTTNAPRTTNIVAPRQEIFMPDHEIVDLSNANVIALNAALMSVTGDTTGHPAGLFIRGTRTVARGS